MGTRARVRRPAVGTRLGRGATGGPALAARSRPSSCGRPWPPLTPTGGLFALAGGRRRWCVQARCGRGWRCSSSPSSSCRGSCPRWSAAAPARPTPRASRCSPRLRCQRPPGARPPGPRRHLGRPERPRHPAYPAGGAAIVVVAVSAVVGVRRWWRPRPTSRRGWPPSGLVGLALALALTTGPGQDLLRHAVTSVPGVGLLRDGQKLLAPFVVLVACLFGGAVDVARACPRPVRRRGRRDRRGAVRPRAGRCWCPTGRVPCGAPCSPFRSPPRSTRSRPRSTPGPPGRALVTLPWRSYRNFAWGTGYPSSDPLVRMVDRPVITSEDLGVGDRVVRGESGVAPGIGDALPRRSPPTCCPAYGVGWVVVYADDPAAPQVDVTGLRRELADPRAHPVRRAGRRRGSGARDLASADRDRGGPAGPSPGARIGRGVGLLAGRSRAVGDAGEPLLQSAKPSPKEP